MKKSPFHEYGNATLRLEIASGALVTDPTTGNVKPIAQTIEFWALLKSKPSKDDMKLREMAGVDVASVYVEGWLIGAINSGVVQGLETAFFPEGIRVPLEIEAEVDRRAGRLQILPGVASPYGVDRYTGQKIFGYFSHRKGA
ncbi:hypothetical protein [Anabaena lutea]|uniref:Uncharacterized protein n=1 Tax=Anabaena lutea FACHB-196 TaxID=2692881 RepID=A0ABR8FJU3_9NOST|nr:hypothetical protein [Anabaena lutea]MBD2570051.1 hypothetical protein [Anabaena lutea FACHB-196]